MRFRTREITLAAMFVALSVISVYLARVLPELVILGAGVPISLLPFISVLAGAILGKRLGATAMAAYMLLGLVGLPVFADGGGGFVYVLKPTFGFILGFIAAAYFSGWIAEKRRSAVTYVLGSLLGLSAIYLIGMFYMWAILNFYLGKSAGFAGLFLGMVPFLVKDVIFNVLAGLLAYQVTSRLPQKAFNSSL